MRPVAKFRVGDRVRIVSALNCSYGCNDEMLQYVDQEGDIIARERDGDRYAYRLSVDHARFMWCDKCIEEALPQPDIAESDANIGILLS